MRYRQEARGTPRREKSSPNASASWIGRSSAYRIGSAKRRTCRIRIRVNTWLPSSTRRVWADGTTATLARRIRSTKALRVEDAEGQAVGAPANPTVRPGRAPVEERESERGHRERLRGRVILGRGAVVVEEGAGGERLRRPRGHRRGRRERNWKPRLRECSGRGWGGPGRRGGERASEVGEDGLYSEGLYNEPAGAYLPSILY